MPRDRMIRKLARMTGATVTPRALSGALVLLSVGVLAVAAGPLATLPVLFAFLPLLAGRYLGAGALERLIEARFPPARPRSPRRLARPRVTPVVLMARGGALLARSLAERPPPAAPSFS